MKKAVIAALAAEGTSVIEDIRFIERGYEDFEQFSFFDSDVMSVF